MEKKSKINKPNFFVHGKKLRVIPIYYIIIFLLHLFLILFI